MGEDSPQMERLKAQKEAKKGPSRSLSAQRQPRRQGSAALLDGSSAGADELRALPAVSESLWPRLRGPLEQPAKALFREPLSGSVSRSAPSM